MDNKKSVERKCLDKTRAYTYYSSKSPKYILEFLQGEIVECESPDFIIKRNAENIGVEHFIIDTLIEKKKISRSRSRQSEIQRTFDKYHDNLDGNDEQALGEIQNIVQADIDAVQNFDYNKFVSEFERIIKQHAKKTQEYKRNNLTEIVFLIEIPISRMKLVGINKEFKLSKIKGRKFPITEGMIKVLKQVKQDVDFIIISIMRDDYKRVPFSVYAFDCIRIDESIDSMKNDIYMKFTYDLQLDPVKAKVNLKLEKNK